MRREQSKDLCTRMSDRRDSTCQKNDLPKSLQGTEDAEFVWSMITERFPNAAPLLCEMDAVIERAEDLLDQLRTPCCREIETSTSFCTPESMSMLSARGSIITENEVTYESVENECQTVPEVHVSECKMCGEDIGTVNLSRQSIPQEVETVNQSSDSFESTEKSNSSKADTHVDHRTTKEARSLEEWEKVVNDALQKSVMEDTSPRGSVAKNLDTDEKKPEINIQDRNVSCIVLHRQEMKEDVGDSNIEIDTEQIMNNQEIIEIKEDVTNVPNVPNVPSVPFKGSGDECSHKLMEQTPLEILESYADRCKELVTYEYITDGPFRHKPNVCVIRGNFGGFTAMCRGEVEESVKNCLATKILQMIANQQIKDEKLGPLKELSKEEMLEIINFDVGSPMETAQRKLYRLCLEKQEEVPRYSIEKTNNCLGLTYVATCSALGLVCEGHGVRACVAKKSAAEEVYRQYWDRARN